MPSATTTEEEEEDDDDDDDKIATLYSQLRRKHGKTKVHEWKNTVRQIRTKSNLKAFRPPVPPEHRPP
ncbi:hypothetical protein N7470_000242 [Penicillium chermesinum]|nr:hypothetical protein N7470_000242 [Penicillium chermesinum]